MDSEVYALAKKVKSFYSVRSSDAIAYAKMRKWVDSLQVKTVHPFSRLQLFHSLVAAPEYLKALIQDVVEQNSEYTRVEIQISEPPLGKDPLVSRVLFSEIDPCRDYIGSELIFGDGVLPRDRVRIIHDQISMPDFDRFTETIRDNRQPEIRVDWGSVYAGRTDWLRENERQATNTIAYNTMASILSSRNKRVLFESKTGTRFSPEELKNKSLRKYIGLESYLSQTHQENTLVHEEVEFLFGKRDQSYIQEEKESIMDMGAASVDIDVNLPLSYASSYMCDVVPAYTRFSREGVLSSLETRRNLALRAVFSTGSLDINQAIGYFSRMNEHLGSQRPSPQDPRYKKRDFAQRCIPFMHVYRSVVRMLIDEQKWVEQNAYLFLNGP